MNNKFKRKHVDDLLEWLENDSSNCSLEEIKEKYSSILMPFGISNISSYIAVSHSIVELYLGF